MQLTKPRPFHPQIILSFPYSRAAKTRLLTLYKTKCLCLLIEKYIFQYKKNPKKCFDKLSRYYAIF